MGGYGGNSPNLWFKGTTRSARRLLWEVEHGEPAPENRQVSTTCDNRKCMNPAHMWLRPWMDHRARFWSLVRKADGDGCWEWTGTFFANGYAAFSMDRKDRNASRVAWEFTYGAIDGHVPGHPELEVCICHRCDNPRCVRPDHLFLGSDADNCADKVAKGRQAKGPALGDAIRKARAAARANMERVCNQVMGVSSEPSSTESKP